MNEYELIDRARERLNHAEKARNEDKLDFYASHMTTLLDLLLEELVGSVPEARSNNTSPFNPEDVLADIALAIKHRTLSFTERWNIVYYHDRITCVPTHVEMPQEIILGEFTEGMVEKGFTVVYWNQLKTNVTELYKELHK